MALERFRPRNLLARSLKIVRNGPEQVLWTPPNLRVGNWFYFWLWAQIQRENIGPAWVLYDKGMDPWLHEFPILKKLTISSKDVSFSYRRVISSAQSWGEHYSGDQLRDFAQTLASQPPFVDRVRQAEAVIGNHTLAVNVRRGDYYTSKELRSRYGMNIKGWLDVAVPLAKQAGGVTQIQVVSDDLDWCRSNLRHLNDFMDTSFDRVGNGPEDDLSILTAARSLVLTNSTFSYWGAHLNGGFHSTGSAKVLAPIFHARGLSKNDLAWQLDPNWQVVMDIPGGWSDPADQ